MLEKIFKAENELSPYAVVAGRIIGYFKIFSIVGKTYVLKQMLQLRF